MYIYMNVSVCVSSRIYEDCDMMEESRKEKNKSETFTNDSICPNFKKKAKMRIPLVV